MKPIGLPNPSTMSRAWIGLIGLMLPRHTNVRTRMVEVARAKPALQAQTHAP